MFSHMIIFCRIVLNAIPFNLLHLFPLQSLSKLLSSVGLLILLFSLPSFGQTTIKGVIKDKHTKQPIPSVSISFAGVSGGTVSDKEGFFQIRISKTIKGLVFSAIGYKKHHFTLSEKESPYVNIELEELRNDLDGVSIVAAKRPRYRNKNNEAVELIKHIIDHRDKNRNKQDSTVVFKLYEKLNMSLNMGAAEIPTSSFLRKFPFLLKTADTVRLPGRALIPLFMRERLSLCQETKDHVDDKSVVLDEKQSRVDQGFDEDGIDEYLNHIYQHVDIYDHDISLGSQRFLSPISSLAPEFYKYFITDTIKDVKPYVVRLAFSPRSKQDQLFMGEMLIPLDGNYAVSSVTLYLNKAININWVNDFQASVDYKRDKKGQYYIAKSTTAMDLGLFKGKHSLYGVRTVGTFDYTIGNKGVVFPMPKTFSSRKKRLDTFSRPLALSSLELNAYKNIDSLKESPKFKRFIGLSTLVMSGYNKRGPIDIGPVTSFYSFNNVEGTRLRLSARTNEDFSDKWVVDGGVAYGTKDKQWKHAVGVIYSFKPEGVLRYPINSITIKSSYETQIPGQDFSFIEEDNFLLSFKRGVDDKRLYTRKWSGEYFREMENNLSYRLGYRNQEFNPAGGLIFQPESGAALVHNLQVSEFTSEFRWAPKEQFFQGKRFRRPIKNGHPVFTFRASAAIKGFLGGDYTYQNLSLNIFKRVYVSPFGYSDVILEGGMILGKVPFPLLSIHKANQTYSYQIQSYNLMNFMEFMSDRYANINIDHSLNGLLLNKIPLIKRLQLREVFSAKILYGGISAKNRPENDPDLYRFATDKDGMQTSFGLGKTPYVEGSVGLSNIFKLLRIDYVRRFTYLDHPNVAKSGIRARIHVDF
ncbi:CarboxypepD_reg-like domain-containing protein [Pedobacter sp. ok626]|nr:CarboxypepD_reg-like domain-containing protein [Pedobacter sp. ok626]